MSLWDIFGFGNRVMDKFVPGRKERWRNKIAKLEKERDALLKKECTPKESRRLAVVKRDLERYNRLCKNEQ